MADVKIEAAISRYYYRMERRPTMPKKSKILKHANHRPYIGHRSWPLPEPETNSIGLRSERLIVCEIVIAPLEPAPWGPPRHRGWPWL